MFEKAARLKLRFETRIGLLNPEDLWDLPLVSSSRPNLDDIARDLYRQLKSDSDVSFVEKERKSDEKIQLKFDLVKHVIDVRLVEDQAERDRRTNADRKQKLLSIISDREDEALKSLPMDELRRIVEAL